MIEAAGNLVEFRSILEVWLITEEELSHSLLVFIRKTIRALHVKSTSDESKQQAFQEYST